MVSELIDHASASWDIQLLEEHFYDMDKAEILNIPLSSKVQADFWSWHYEKTGVFIVCSAYAMLVSTRQRREAWLEETAGSSSDHAEGTSWKYLWKVKVPGKVRMFLWLLARQSLPTEDIRSH